MTQPAPISARDVTTLNQQSTEEQLGDLRKQLRALMLRIERIEEHTHGPDGQPTITLRRCAEVW